MGEDYSVQKLACGLNTVYNILTLYPFCEEFVAGITPCLETLLENGELTRREDQEHFKRLQQLQTVFENGDRQAYMQELQIREQKTRNLINRYCGYPF